MDGQTGGDTEYVEDEFDNALYNIFVEAASEYRESNAYRNLSKPSREHFDRAMRTIKAREAQQFRLAQMDEAGVWQERQRLGNFTITGEPSEKTKRIVNAIRKKHPTQFNYGGRCGFFCAAHDADLFKHLTADERDAFFAGYNIGRNERLCAGYHAEAAE